MPIIANAARVVARYVSAGTRTVIDVPLAPLRIFGTFGRMEIKGDGVVARLEGKADGESPRIIAPDPLPPGGDPEGQATIRIVEINPFRLLEGEKLRIVIEDPNESLDRVTLSLEWFPEGG